MSTFNFSTIADRFSEDANVPNTTLSAMLCKVYWWMTLSLILTGFTAFAVSKSTALIELLYTKSFMSYALIGVQLVLAFLLIVRLNKLSFTGAGILFALYSLLTGVMFSSIFVQFTSESIALTFFITAGTFAGMSVYGYFTKKNLNSIGSFLIMGLWGVILASLTNLFLQSAAIQWITSYVGVIVFVGLTAYDTQKIKETIIRHSQDGITDATMKVALFGSFMLYLDFINLFLELLEFLGRSDD
jgi:FtsH-binding integral membrane protein